MRAYRTPAEIIIEDEGKFFPLAGLSWDDFIRGDTHELAQTAARGQTVHFDASSALAPIVSQEVWAAGVTYYRSRDARMRESHDAGGGDFYARVYNASRPELFFKATGRRVVGTGAPVRIRRDSHWNVAEPELTLLINPAGNIIGYTIGNDMSSRDIEGENPLTCLRPKSTTAVARSAPACCWRPRPWRNPRPSRSKSTAARTVPGQASSPAAPRSTSSSATRRNWSNFFTGTTVFLTERS